MDTLARTIWGEARGESAEGQVAVAWVIKNRAAAATAFVGSRKRSHPLYGDGTLAGACRARWQFSAWNENDPNRAKLEQIGFADRAFCRAFAIACSVWSGDSADPTGGATHYHHHRIEPDWASAMRPVAIIGNHIFYT